jgi:serine/threonine-protein kinase
MPTTQSVPRSIGRYAIYDEIDAGGLGAVHFARLLGPSGFARTVVAKLPHAQYFARPELRSVYIDEACLAARVRHPNVVPTLDVIQTPCNLAVVMEYVHGDSLCKLAEAARLRSELVPLPIAAAIIVDTLHGLHAAHEACDNKGLPLGIVHRDVSPQNILVGVDGISRLGDFGVAKATSRLQDITAPGQVKGKYAYMAPEQMRAEPVTRTADLFATAIVFWELVTGRYLFLAAMDEETVNNCLTLEIPLPGSIVPGLPPGLDEIFRRGLAREQDRRYQTAREMALDIEACIAAVRPSEVGAWVQRMVGDRLAKRAHTIAEIEKREMMEDEMPTSIVRSEEHGVADLSDDTIEAVPASSARPKQRDAMPPPGPSPANYALSLTVAAQPRAKANVARSARGGSWLAASPVRAVLAAARAGRRLGERLLADLAQIASSHRRAWTHRPLRGVLVAAALLALVVLGSSSLASLRRKPTLSPISSTVSTQTSTPSVAASPAVAPQPIVDSDTHSERTVDLSMLPMAPPAAAARSPRGMQTSQTTRRAARGACDPPYSVDSKGLRVYKAACL